MTKITCTVLVLLIFSTDNFNFMILYHNFKRFVFHVTYGKNNFCTSVPSTDKYQLTKPVTKSSQPSGFSRSSPSHVVPHTIFTICVWHYVFREKQRGRPWKHVLTNFLFWVENGLTLGLDSSPPSSWFSSVLTKWIIQFMIWCSGVS